MKRNPSSIPIVAGLLLVALVTGCSKEEPPKPAPVPKPAPPKPAVTPQAAVQKQASSAGAGLANLDFRRRTDPFKPFAPAVEVPAQSKAGRPAGAPRNTEGLLPIQTYDVGKFRVVGIVAGLKENRALVVDPAGKGYVVHEGMQIGSNEGRVSRITATGVEVIERFKEDSGRYKRRKIILPLAKKQGK
jgi:type IV pilus assembly protein PilP